MRIASYLSFATLGLLASCARVEPRPDYARLSQMVGERSGITEVYDPCGDDRVAGKVAELFRGELTVDKAVRITLLNNPAFQAGFAELGSSRADVVQSALFTNPAFSFGWQFPDTGGRSKLTAGLAQQIADLWQIPVRKKIAEAELERTVLAAARRGIELVAETRTRCYRLLALQRNEVTLQEGRALAERAVNLAQAQLTAGEVSQFDLNLARAALLDVDLELLALQRERRTAEIDLARTLGLSRLPQAWTLADDLPAAQPGLPDDAELMAVAVEQRLDARAALLAIGAAQDELTRQYLRAFPDLTLGFDFERPDQRALPGRKILADTVRLSIAAGKLTAPSVQSRGERRIEAAQIVDSLLGPSLTVTLPLWDQNQAQIAKARFVVSQRRKELEDLLDSIAAEVQQAAATARNAQALVQVYEREALPQAEENAAASLRLYENGEQNILIVLDSQESLLRRRRSYVEARRDYAIALAALEQALASRLAALPTPVSAPAVPADDSENAQ
jgi:cobalt-zinc-cadmium efflux system outer membrane protein